MSRQELNYRGGFEKNIALATRTFMPDRELFTLMLKATNNAKRERAKSQVVEETKAVFEFGQKFVVNGKPPGWP